MSEITPIDPPYQYGKPSGGALFKQQPEDFQVEEILGFEPSGEGEHCFLWVEKTDRNSNDVAGHLADRLGIRKRLVSHCGLKDKHAVTRQWFSLHLPGQESPEASVLEDDGLRILKISRNGRKLRRGSHDGNRFVIRLRDFDGSRDELAIRAEQLVTQGVPNYFGPQRFGRGGGNVRQALQFLSGEMDVRDRLLRGILISSARSYLFNRFLAERVQGETWDSPMKGEVFGFAENRSLILPENLRGDESARHAAGLVELTAPLWGAGDLQSQGEVADFETRIAGKETGMTSCLEALGLRQERRVIRLIPRNFQLKWVAEKDLVMSFDLPKGTYATTVLRELLVLNESGDEPR